VADADTESAVLTLQVGKKQKIISWFSRVVFMNRLSEETMSSVDDVLESLRNAIEKTIRNKTAPPKPGFFDRWLFGETSNTIAEGERKDVLNIANTLIGFICKLFDLQRPDPPLNETVAYVLPENALPKYNAAKTAWAEIKELMNRYPFEEDALKHRAFFIIVELDKILC